MTIEFTLPQPEYVDLKVYNILGKEVAELVSNNLIAGVHQYQFNGSGLASGVYYYERGVQRSEEDDFTPVNLLKTSSKGSALQGLLCFWHAQSTRFLQ